GTQCLSVLKACADIRLSKQFSFLIKAAAFEIDPFRFSVLRQVVVTRPQRTRETVIDNEAVQSQPPRWFDQLRPCQFPRTVFLQGQFHPTNGSGNPCGSITDERTTFAFYPLPILAQLH